MVNDVKPGGVFMINCQWDFDELNHHLKADAKRYIAKNNIQLYTINAIDLAIKIGMGKRTNTILQSAFFTLAKVMPEEQAIQYMKDAATQLLPEEGPGRRRYEPQGHRRSALPPSSRSTFPPIGPTLSTTGRGRSSRARPSSSSMVKNILDPVDKMDGDSLPVSAFMHSRGRPVRAGRCRLRKARRCRVRSRLGCRRKCIQCNNCAYVCPHATIRPFALTEEEAKNAPAACQDRRHQGWQGQGRLQVHDGYLPAGLHGLRRLRRPVPGRVL